MAFQMKNQKILDNFIERVLDGYKNGDTDRDRATGILALVVAMAALDNVDELKSYVQLPDETLFDD